MKFKEATGAMDSKNYLRLKDKESAKGLFVGELYEFRQHWIGNRSSLCSEDAACPQCSTGLKSSFRFRVNFIINDNGNYVSKVIEQGWTFYESLRSLNSEYDLESHLVKITRTGSGQNDTSYSIIPVLNGKLTNEMAKTLAKVPLQDIRHKDEPQRLEAAPTKKDDNFTPEPAFNSDEEMPF